MALAKETSPEQQEKHVALVRFTELAKTGFADFKEVMGDILKSMGITTPNAASYSETVMTVMLDIVDVPSALGQGVAAETILAKVSEKALKILEKQGLLMGNDFSDELSIRALEEKRETEKKLARALALGALSQQQEQTHERAHDNDANLTSG